MAQSESVQLAPGPLFHRVAQTATASPVNVDGHMERIDVSLSPRVSISTPQSVENLTEKDACDSQDLVQLPKSRLIIAVDFGTTYSTVSYAKIDAGVDSTRFPTSKICCINNYEWANGNSDARANARIDNVPTKLLYLGPGVPDSDQSDLDPDADEDSLSDVDTQPIPAPECSNRRRRKRGRKSIVLSPRRKPRTTWSRPAGVTVHWGFSVQGMQENPYTLARYPKKEAVELIKLTLGEDPNEDKDLREKRAELTRQIKRLCSESFILDRNHLLYDYLARLLQHAKVVLGRDGLLEAAQLEYVLCVPVSWSANACRTMHDAMVKAVQASRLAVLAQGLIPDLFIVSEPEAAAQYVIASLGSEGRLRQGEVFIILDAGGGTVDITTYKVTSTGMGPLRLQGEAIPPDGALCGSSLITERYLSKIRGKLKDMDPTGDLDLLENVATSLANQWDMLHKPHIDFAQKKKKKAQPRLERNQHHRGQLIKWTEDEILEIFEPSLNGTTNLLERQLRLAKEKNLIVNKLIVVGGFGESPALRTRILQVLSTCYNSSGEKIEVIWPKDLPTSTVARGAVLRALDKRNGPSRISRSSFGFLRHEPHGAFKEHDEANVVPTRDGIDHDKFVRDTIFWVTQAVSGVHSVACYRDHGQLIGEGKQGDQLPSMFQTKPILSYHTFALSDVRLICVEKLYVSPRRHRSHFQWHHPENEGASLLSFIEIDVSDWRKEFPCEDKVDVGPRAKESNRQFRVVMFDLVIIVEGRQLKYEARWPNGATTPEEVRIRKSGYVSLAPSLAPGTE